MPLQIIIDGYNLIRQSPFFKSYENQDLEQGRRELIKRLDFYRKTKGNPVTIVFDGWQGGELREQQELWQGLKIIYSKKGEKADEVIKRMAEREREKIIVVTSDRELADFCEKRGATVISSYAFEKKMEEATLQEIKGLFPEKEEAKDLTDKKKGPAQRLPKRRRKFLQKIRKL